jgi:hypothetical protein
MGFSLYWFEEEDIDDAEDDFSSKVAENLENALEEKQRQIKWKNSISGLNRRFHNSFSLDGLHIVEIAFQSSSGNYRAVCIVIPSEEAVVYFKTVPKKGSHQQRLLELIRENSDDINRFIQKKADQLSS